MCSLAAGVLLSRVLGLSRFVLSQRARGSYDYVFWRRACVCTVFCIQPRPDLRPDCLLEVPGRKRRRKAFSWRVTAAKRHSLVTRWDGDPVVAGASLIAHGVTQWE